MPPPTTEETSISTNELVSHCLPHTLKQFVINGVSTDTWLENFFIEACSDERLFKEKENYFKNLTYFSDDSRCMTSERLSFIIKQACTSLKELVVINSKSVEQIDWYNKLFPNLEKIVLKFRLNSGGLKEVKNFNYTNFPKLTNIEIRDCQISDSLKEFFKPDPKIKFVSLLSSIDFSGTKVDNSIFSLMNQSHFPNLKKIDVGNTNVNWPIITSFSLNEITLNEVNLPEDSYTHLYKSKFFCPNVETLSTTKSRVKSKARDIIKRKVCASVKSFSTPESTVGVSPLVISPGSYAIQAGFAGDDAPRAVFQSTIAFYKSRGSMIGGGNREYVLGDEAISKAGIMNLHYPISTLNINKQKEGSLQFKSSIEKFLHHTFYNELAVAPEEHPVLDIIRNFDISNKKLCEKTMIYFEEFHVPALGYTFSGITSMYGSGFTDGMVLEVSKNLASCSAISSGYILRSSIQYTQLGGDDARKILQKILKSRSFESPSKRTARMDTLANDLNCKLTVDEIMRKEGFTWSKPQSDDVLRNMLYESAYSDKVVRWPRPDSQLEGIGEKHNYELPDGSVITLDDYMRAYPNEIFFNPERFGIKYNDRLSVPDILRLSIGGCPVDLRSDLAGNVILSGGATLSNGFEARLGHEMNNECDFLNKYSTDKLGYFGTICRSVDMRERYGNVGERKVVRIKALPERRYLSWIGGSILASLTSYQDSWITSAYYDEHGPDRVAARALSLAVED